MAVHDIKVTAFFGLESVKNLAISGNREER